MVAATFTLPLGGIVKGLKMLKVPNCVPSAYKSPSMLFMVKLVLVLFSTEKIKFILLEKKPRSNFVISVGVYCIWL